MKWVQTPIETTKLASTAPIPISAPRRGIRLPKKTMRKKATAGNDGMSQANRSTPRSPLQEIDLVDVDGLPVPVDQDDDGQPDPDLRRRHGDDEQREHLAGELVQIRREGHKVHVHRVQHQLDRHQHEDGIAPGQDSVDTRREEDGSEDQEEGQPDGGGQHGPHHRRAPSRGEIVGSARPISGTRRSGGSEGPSSLRAMTTAPTSAASNSTDTTSNGRTKSRKIATPTWAVVTGWRVIRLPPNSPWIRRTRPASTPAPVRKAKARCWLSSVSRPIGAFVSIRLNRTSTMMAPT